MKKMLLTLGMVFTYLMLTAQVVVTEPAFITKNYTGTIVVTFDPALGNAGMSTATTCYAHTGLITSASADDSQWKYTTDTWRGGAAKNKMTKVGTKWQLTISNIYTFYGCPTNTDIRKMAFVFNDGPAGTKEGKTADNSDILIDLYEAGLNAKFISPENDQLIQAGTAVNFTASSSISAAMELKINGTSKKTSTGTTLAHSETFSVTGDYECVLSATANSITVRDTVMICVASSPTVQARPSGVLEGITYNGTNPNQVTLVMYAKDKANVIADNVFVLGDFNNWSYSNTYQLKKDGTTGYFWLTINGLEAGKEYAFQYGVKIGSKVVQISDAYTEKILDPWNDKYISNDTYPNLTYPTQGDGPVSVFQTNKSAFNWSNETLNFTGPDKNNLVVYELWIHDFSPLRTIKAVTNRLDYLQSLGVNAIELMPITEFDGNISWGYNPNHFFAPDKSYGTPNDYKIFIDECHKRGMAVILDMVFNHATGINPWAKLYSGSTGVASNNPWFNTIAPHDASVNQDYNHDFDGTRNYFKRVLQYWINEYKIDGYRMDLSKGLCGANCNNRINIVNDYYNSVKSVKSNAYFILEHWFGSEEQGYVNNGMLCWGGGEGMNSSYSQTAMGWLKEGDDISAANKKGWVYYCESHDEERNFYKAKAYGNGNLKTDETARLNRVPLNVAFNTLMQGPKMLWQFEELGYDYTIFSNSTGGVGERVDPKPVPESLGWYKNTLRMNNYQKVAQILQLREKYNTMFLNGTCTVRAGSGVSTRYIQWSHNSDKLVVVGNFNVVGGTTFTGSTTVAPFASTGTYYEYFTGATLSVTNSSQTISLEPGELRIYTSTQETLPTVPATFDFEDFVGLTPIANASNHFVYPTITDQTIYIATEQLPQYVQVYTLRGDLVKLARHTTELNVSDLKSGLYLMVVTFDKTQEAFKFMRK